MLVGALRAEFPDMPIHVHTHDTAGNSRKRGVFSAHSKLSDQFHAFDIVAQARAWPP